MNRNSRCIPFARLASANLACSIVFGAMLHPVAAGTGDAQVRSDHPWYPGELAMSTFERLFATQAEQYGRVTGRSADTDEDRALAAWLFRNTHYAHAEEGAADWWGEGFGAGGDRRYREYWTGMFSHGFGLCGTTHSQWTAELQALLGHERARGAGTKGHNALEVWLTGGAYGAGRWVLLDHDLSTVVFDEAGESLLGLAEIVPRWQTLTRRDHLPGRQRGWLVCGLHPGDGAAFAEFRVAEYLPGYAGPPPMIHLRRGETLRRYLKPGLGDGETFVFWGRNYLAGGTPGPERSRSWVNQPEVMHGSVEGTPHRDGQVRYANAVFVYRPDFETGDYREGVVREDHGEVVFEFHSPYVIGATPPDDSSWGIYKEGCRNGLVLSGRATCPVALSLDGGATWEEAGEFREGLDLTDFVKGRRHYLIRFGAGASELAGSGLTLTTVCQAAVGTIPRLRDGGTRIEHAISGRALVSAGPELSHARGALVGGDFGSPEVALELSTPRGESVRAVHAAAHVASGNPPDPAIAYHIEWSADRGRSWQPLVDEWRVLRQGDEPAEFWSQSFCYGSLELPAEVETDVLRVRFRNGGGKRYLRAEMHLEYDTSSDDALRATFAWDDAEGNHVASHDFSGDQPWQLQTGRDVRTHWIELEPVAAP